MDKHILKQRRWFDMEFKGSGTVLQNLSYRAERFVNYYPLIKVIQMLPTSLEDKTVLIINAGTGLEAEFFSRQGARVTVTDISEVAVETLLKECPCLSSRIEDSENLSFEDGSFDWVMVNNGLHHLARPMKGIYEMERVAREGFIFIEAQDSFFMRLLIWLGVINAYEGGPGNYTYRFTRHDVKRLSESLCFKYIIHTAWCQEYVPLFNKFIYPYLNGKKGFWLFKKAFYLGNFMFGRWGNKFIAIIIKSSERLDSKCR